MDMISTESRNPIFTPAHIHILSMTIKDLLSKEFCPCKNCLVMSMCLHERETKIGLKKKDIRVVSKMCKELEAFLNEENQRYALAMHW